MEVLRPGLQPIDLETWFLKNFDPGIMHFLRDELGLDEAEMAVETAIWREFTSTRVPPFYPGFLDVLARFEGRGGRVAVVSHSEADVILGHYRGAANGNGVLPDLIFGWDLEPELRKPSPYPVLEILRRLEVAPQEALVVDDLKPGVLMARAAGVDVAAAGWSHDIPVIREYMQRSCVAYLESVGDLAALVLG